MAYREVTNQSWGGRLMASIGGALFGGLLFLAAFAVLWWNEGRAVHTEQSLAEGAKNVVSIDADKLDAANEGKLVHVTAKAVTDETPADPDFGVQAPKNIRLSRKVEMYQHKEEAHKQTQKKLGGGEETVTTYSYDPVWSETFLDSRNFHEPAERDSNPPAMPYKSQSWQAKQVTAGAFELPANLVAKIGGAKELPVAAPPAPKDKASVKPTDKDAPKPPAPDTADTADTDAAGKPEDYKVVQGRFYKGQAPDSPAIGDVRVSYEEVEPQTVSVMAVQKGASFGPYQAQAGDEIEMLKAGDYDAASMFTEAQENNKTLTWILRGVGFLMMAFGLFLVMNPLSVLGDVVPFIGNMVGALLAVVAGLIALGLSLITIALAWLAYRPLLGVPLLAAGIGALVLVAMLARRRKRPIEAGA